MQGGNQKSVPVALIQQLKKISAFRSMTNLEHLFQDDMNLNMQVVSDILQAFRSEARVQTAA